MKKSGLCCLGLAVALSMIFWNSVAMAVEKIGFVNMREIIQTSEVGKKTYGELNKALDRDRTTLQNKQAELAKLKDEIDKQRSVMKPEILKEKESAFQKKVRDAQLMARDFEEELTKREQAFVSKILPDIVKIIRSIGEKEKYTMIVDPIASQFPYHSKGNDITSRVISEFNALNKKKK